MLVIRMRRAGSKKRPFFRVVVIEKSGPRDGSFVELLGDYNPRTTPETMHVNRERLEYWLKQGAKASDSIRTLISRMPLAPAAEAAPAAAETAGQAAS
ncbi:MAG TPA: 30S ribosomal protein S16 [Vicinamibacterales bacterium]|nr:30S ribosomal protein S16 [Vicinamibacterales bacterium]